MCKKVEEITLFSLSPYISADTYNSSDTKYYYLYFGETRRVPFALGIKPFAFKEDRMVNPIDLPRFHLAK